MTETSNLLVSFFCVASIIPRYFNKEVLLGEEQEWMHKLGTYTKQDATLYGVSLVDRNKAM